MAHMILRMTLAVALLLAGSAAGAPDLQGPHRACIQASSGGYTWYYDIRTSVAGTTMDRWRVNGVATYVDRNAYAAFHLPEGGLPTWDEGVAFAATMQTRNAWLNTAPTSAATWTVNGAEDTMTFRTTVNGGPQDYIFRTSQCLSLEAPGSPTAAPVTDVPSGGQQPDTPVPASGVVHACLQASSGGFTYFYDIVSNLANDAAGTSFKRYRVINGVDVFVDNNSFAALRNLDPSLPWNQGIQFASTMQSRGVWINSAATTFASIAHDNVSGEDTLLFRTTVNGAPQDYVFRKTQCRVV